MTPVITATELVVRFGDTVALDGVNLDVAAGSVLGVLGPNGAGKTTFVRVLATQQTPTSGRVSVAGHDVVTDRRQVQRRIGVTGQYAALDHNLTVVENLRVAATLAGLARPVAESRITELRAQLDLPSDRVRLAQLSGGTRRRVDLAAGLLTEPAVVLLDEPTTGLDPHSRRELWDVVAALRDRGVTVVLTTQYLEEADHLADRVVFFHHGRIVADGTPAEVKARVGGQVVSVTLTTADDLELVRARLETLGAGLEVDPGSRRVTARCADTASALELVASLHLLGVAIDGLGVTTASLDDAFHEVTTR